MTYSDTTKRRKTKRLYYANMPAEQRQRYNDTRTAKYHDDPTYNAKLRLAQRKYHRERRQEVLAAYGGACACCGETTPEFLVIDHINNDGAEHRKEVGARSVYIWLRRSNYPNGFQCLCHNCNIAKEFYGGCPHVKS